MTLGPASRDPLPVGPCPVEVPVRVMVDPAGNPTVRGPDPEYRAHRVLRTTLTVSPAAGPTHADLAGPAGPDAGGPPRAVSDGEVQ